ncbi:MAG: hypothetical protein UT66_C0032G0003 [candidate division CPR2 bacterium GW2011_GWC1_39_9]|uniref:Glycosyltransferase RgtA/B/C/D-like domain-containing protein n=1 Tax=candidate division CPR2 bacterium GW2011_GWC2_39_10 TaxID=1618345 RepID=A0A0G0M3D1_UNCC2|nr:MAG: hypothetical protein UT18_C0007G0121 [candidate division CPR2 bacterium GW2011_GWC2_39_10]KKR33911.1 MAG: hypothetical protein UT66_C0032G0003 [candidate division CPR2 bacterium GW2011_GWC1_39_9]
MGFHKIKKICFSKNFGLKTLFSTCIKFARKNKYEITFGLIFLLGIFLRFFRLNILPPGAYVGEISIINDSIPNLKIGSDVFYKLIIVLASKISGDNTLVLLRFISAFLGSLLILFVYLLSKEWFNQRIALIASFFTAVSFWPLLISRSVVHSNIIPLVLIALLYFASIAFREKKKIYFVITGITLAVGLYSSIVFWLLPILLYPALYFVSNKKPKVLSKYKKEIFLTEIISLFAMVPIIIYLIWNPSKLSFIFPGVADVLKNGFKSLLAFNFESPQMWSINIGKEPLLDPFIGIAFVAGILMAIKYHKKTKQQILLISFVCFMMPAIFSTNYLYGLKMAGVIPIVFIFAAIATDWTLSKWLGLFPFNKNARRLGWTLFFILIFLSSSFNITKYYLVWAGAPETYLVYNEDLVAESRYLNNLGPGVNGYYTGGARSNILNTLSGQKAKKITLEEIGGLNLKGKNVFVIPVSDNIYLNKVQEKFPEGELMWYVSPYSKKILFNIYSINKD